MPQMAPVMTIDGPSGAGKGTLCQLLAEKLGWHLLDSGAIYRVLALAALHHDVELDAEAALVPLAANLDVQFQVDGGQVKVVLEGEDVSRTIRTEEVGNAASKIAAFPRVREALLRMISIDLIVQQPRRGLLVSNIDLAEHLDVIQTRRVLENLLAACAARRASVQQRKDILQCAKQMVAAAKRGNLEEYMHEDHALDAIIHTASRNRSAVKSVTPLIVQCRRFWYAYQHEGD